MLRTILEWLNVYMEYPEEEVHSAAPSLPHIGEIVDFLSALVDGCLPNLARLDRSLLELMCESLHRVQGLTVAAERVYAAVRAACRVRQPMRSSATRSNIEVCLLPL